MLLLVLVVNALSLNWKKQKFLLVGGRSAGCLQTWMRSWTAVYRETTPAKWRIEPATFGFWGEQGLRSGESRLASHQCGPGSIPGPGIISGLSLLLVLYSAPRGFSSPGTPVFPSPQKPTFPNSNSILECTGVLENPWCSMGKQLNYFFCHPLSHAASSRLKGFLFS